MDWNSYIMFWVCILGLCFGSFFNVVILRSLADESIIFPPSKCPKCNHKLYWWHNIPVLSFIILRGKCFFCHEKISIQYPIIEIITMVLFGLIFMKYGISYYTLFMLFWASCFIIMTMTDIKEKLVDCNIAIGAAVAGLIYNYISMGLEGIFSSILGLIAGFLIIELIARLGYVFAGTRAMGEADSYVAGALGAIFGVNNILSVLLYGLAASMLFIVPTFLYNRYKIGDKLTCIMAVLFIVSTMFFKFYTQNTITLAGVIITGLILAWSILKSMCREEKRNYLPYVPALVAGALVYIIMN